ncbi:Phage capsid and scaffold [Streptococcus sp. DD10]|uniref:capsid assembly scaffolding protein Gp46 family protein n=1 Tax=Streptococcus sp. DD10 TaxID=1777878 RepID=UPI000793EF38|nr:DUF4355 domain-containing protein [Streptococcus sp. DD10]KXT73190.1 Phage capsid and scaffold [Streptococcus sp. DD10]
MSEFKVIETQEELDNIIKERIRRERDKFGDYDQLKARVSELETENGALKSSLEDAKGGADKSGQEIAELKAQLAGYETASLRTKIALQHGLPYDLAERLQGDDEASLVLDAERLAGYLKPHLPSAPLKETEPSLGDDKTSQMKQMLRELQPKGE